MTTTTVTPPRPAAPRWLTIPAALLVAGITIVAFVVSYHALRELAALAGFMASSAAMWPLIVDGIIVLTVVVLFSRRGRSFRSTWSAWVGLVGFTAISLVGNGLHTAVVYDTGAGLETWVAIAIGAVPPAGLAYSIHLLVEMVTPEPSVDDVSLAVEMVTSSAPAAVAEADGVPVIDLTASSVTDTADEPVSVTDDSPTLTGPSVPIALTVTTAVDDELDADVNVTADGLTFTDLVSDSASTVSVITDIQTDDEPTVTPEPPVSDPIPATPAEQVAWLVERAEAGHDTSVATIRRLFEDAGRPSSESSVSRRLRDAKKQAPAAFAA